VVDRDPRVHALASFSRLGKIRGGNRCGVRAD
jgi:hypothetical protein